jgi:hypothetical protein
VETPGPHASGTQEYAVVLVRSHTCPVVEALVEAPTATTAAPSESKGGSTAPREDAEAPDANALRAPLATTYQNSAGEEAAKE